VDTVSLNELPIDAIIVKDRHRRDMGDIKSLADSMNSLGLIHPVVVTPDHQLVAGTRRLAAARELGWDVVPVTVIHSLGEAAALFEAERDENTCRKDFTPTEAAAVRRSIADVLAPIAHERKAEAGKTHGRGRRIAPAKLAGAKAADRETRNAAAKGTGYSGATLDKVDKVIEIAADESKPEPVRETAREALTEMNTGGKGAIDSAYKKATRAEQVHDAVAEFPDLSHYADQGKDNDVLRLAGALRGYAEPERSMRIEALRADIAADRNRSAAPTEDTPIDYVALGDKMVKAVNNASQVIAKTGGEETIRAAMTSADQLTISLWRDEFKDLSDACARLAQVCVPQLKVVTK